VPGRLRPHVVWFGEIPLEMERIEAALDACGVFVAIGTSGQVYPAAGFVQAVRRQARCVELNLEETEGTALFHEAQHGPATQIVPAFVERMLASCG
jgi:NAD-dependent deacetylase